MLGEIIAGLAIATVLKTASEWNDTHVSRGRSFGPRLTLGRRGLGIKLTRKYKKVDGPCYSCGGSGEVHGKSCWKCGGSGRYSKRTWYD